MRKIDAFAHILPRRYLDRLDKHLETSITSRQLRYYREGVFGFNPVLTDLEARWRAMDTIGEYAQVLVLAVPPLEDVGPPEVAADFARLANDEMADLVAKHPDRFVGFAAALPFNDIDASLLELDRAVDRLGALGIQMFTNVRGAPIDDARFEPIVARVEEVERMVWLHPTRAANFTDYAMERESNYGLWWAIGWPYETAAALARLVYSGRMEEHPNLKLIAHHGGGMVPHFAARLGMGPGFRQVQDTLPLHPTDYFRRLYADTALFGATHAVRCVIDFFGPANVLFGTDMPLGPPDAVEATIQDVDACGLAVADQSAIYSGNATRLLGIK